MQIEKSILRCLAYFDVFSYPLLPAEVQYFMDTTIGQQETVALLDEMVARDLVYCIEGFYLLRNDPQLVSLRRKRNAYAAQLLPLAYRIGRILSFFPYVRGVGISGSLSKNCADADADIDFFIITKANRLWMARTILHLLKKCSFLAGKQHWFCMNYFIDETALEMKDQNLFIATELVTVKPVAGTAMSDLLAANGWVSDFLPNQGVKTILLPPIGKAWLKTCCEWMFNNRLGSYADDLLMRITRRRWLRKQQSGKRNRKGEPVALFADRHHAKPPADQFQRRLLDLYASRSSFVEAHLHQTGRLRREII